MRNLTNRLGSALRGSLAVAATVLAAACSADQIATPIDVNVTPSGAGANPTQALQLLANGILGTDRNVHDTYVRDVSLFGREAFFFQLQDGRWITHYFRDFNDNTTFAVGNWADRFGNLRNINNFRTAIKSAASLTAAQSAAATGFADTEEALQVLYLVNTRHDLGTPVSVEDDPNTLTPFVSRDSALRFVSGKLDAGFTALQQGGSAFPFALPTAGGSGFTGFSTPAGFARVNRALKARVEAYRGSLGCGAPCYQAARTALEQSFITATLSADNLNTGAYFLYGASTAAEVNLLWSERANMYANMTITTDASVPQTDRRRTEKLITATGGQRSQSGSDASTLAFNIYPANSSPMPLIDNEELWLLRAEILWNTGDRAGAVAALNAVARVAGGASADRYTNVTTDAAFVDALLAERRLSLLMEGHRWVDMRRFNRLAALPAGGTGFTVARQQVVPQIECQARDRSGNAALKGPGCP
jgi:hypothetical protein